MLLGRSSECAVLDALLDAVRGGESRVLVVRGEPGVGKSVMLRYLTDAATGLRVESATGVESEMELPFAGLHQLCAPMLDRLERLPAPQRAALGVAFGLWSGDAPDRYLVGLAVLGLFSEVAGDRPLLAVVDDAQWLDRATVQALEFVGRRLVAESVALVFAVRGSANEEPLAGLPELVLEGLNNGDARALLSSVVRWPLDERVRDRIIAETRGNPLALVELPRGLTAGELAGGFALPTVQPLPDRIEGSFRRRLQELPSETQRLLLVAAAEPVGDPALLWSAAERLELANETADAAVAAGLVGLGTRVTFRHPLVRSAIYRAATQAARREVHGALAQVTDPRRDPDRRAWHRAHATAGPDEDVAFELELSAGRAHARGGLAAAAAFLERASALTLEPRKRAERALAAARLMTQAGAFDAALRLLTAAEAGPLDQLQRARVDLLRGQVAFGSWRGDAPALLLKAAKCLEPLDLALARETYLEALSTAVYAGRFVTSGEPREAAEAARGAPAGSQPPGAPDLLLQGFAMLITDGYAAAGPTLKRAVSAFGDQRISKEEGIRWLWLACASAVRLWDDESWHLLSTRHIELSRAAGALGVLPIALNQRAGLYLYEGEFAAAESLIMEATAVNEVTGSRLPHYSWLGLTAFRGGELDALEPVQNSPQGEPGRRGGAVGPSLMHWAKAVLYNSVGRYQEALEAAEAARADPYELVFPMWAAIELIEAATRSGIAQRGAEALERLSETTRAGGTDWALGVEARSRALLSEGRAAEALYREAIERLGRTRMRIELARGHLLYGEWLRRERRRIDGREQLRRAHEMFVQMGAEGFGERAERELQATGGRARRRSIETSGQLTPQEAQVARLARSGLSNTEIGARLFISARTVQYHLRKVFTKLDITSRTQLDGTLPSDPSVGSGE
jgi:DNA-binding CsgD family transcriptional regulator/tetratricopeptide (TPR) repeat protein